MYDRYIDSEELPKVTVVRMSMGAYDEQEHERREQKTSRVDTDFDDDRTEYHGTIEFDSGDSAEDLLAQFQQMKSR